MRIAPEESPLTTTDTYNAAAPLAPSPKVKASVTLCEHLSGYKSPLPGAPRLAKGEGVIKNMVLDPTGHRLAVLLYDGLIAVYRVHPSSGTQPNSMLLKPVGYAKLHAKVGKEVQDILPAKMAFSRSVVYVFILFFF